jgi:phosphate uptake regulator
MIKDPATVEPALDLILISRHLERLATTPTNIAEDVIVMVSAQACATIRRPAHERA